MVSTLHMEKTAVMVVVLLLVFPSTSLVFGWSKEDREAACSSQKDQNVFLFDINGNQVQVDKLKLCQCASARGLVLYFKHLPQRGSRKLLSVVTHTQTDGNLEETSFLIAALPGMLLLCCSFLCPCFHARRKDTSHTVLDKDLASMESISHPEGTLLERVPASPIRVPPSPSRFSVSPKVTTYGSVHLNMSQIMKATRNFSTSLQVGEGGFGTVYRGQLSDGQVVAIKRAKKEHFDSLRAEFSSEVEMLAKIEHRNLVKLLGYVDNGNERIIITEFVPNGTLREHLDGQHGRVLDFNQRLEISIDIAHGLTYLHLYAEKQIIHRDVKSSNILLTEGFRAKVADFGFARLGPAEANQTHILTKVKGTAGYLDPEYLRTYELTNKSDVFSYGVLLVEILTGRRPVEMRRVVDDRITIRWAFKQYTEGNLKQMLDTSMNEMVDKEILSKMFGLAFQCAAPTRKDRPNMKEVGEQLWGIRTDYLRSVKRGGGQ